MGNKLRIKNKIRINRLRINRTRPVIGKQVTADGETDSGNNCELNESLKVIIELVGTVQQIRTNFSPKHRPNKVNKSVEIRE